jgi:hypothetical protein
MSLCFARISRCALPTSRRLARVPLWLARASCGVAFKEQAQILAPRAAFLASWVRVRDDA